MISITRDHDIARHQLSQFMQQCNRFYIIFVVLVIYNLNYSFSFDFATFICSYQMNAITASYDSVPHVPEA